MAEARPGSTPPETVCEHVRQRLGFQLVADVRQPDGVVPLIQLAPEWEEKFLTYELEGERRQDIALPPSEFNKLANSVAEKIAAAGETGAFPAVITSSRRRRYLRTVLSARGITNSVLSYEELGTDAKPAIVGQVPA